MKIIYRTDLRAQLDKLSKSTIEKIKYIEVSKEELADFIQDLNAYIPIETLRNTETATYRGMLLKVQK